MGKSSENLDSVVHAFTVPESSFSTALGICNAVTLCQDL